MKKIYNSEKLKKNLDEVMDVFDNTVKPKLIENIKKCGLNIHEISFRKTGQNSDIWVLGDALRFTITAKRWFPENTKGASKFKFLTFKDWSSSGNSTNHYDLIKKASDLEQKIGFDCQVNPCSLEIRLREGENPDSKLVLIDLWLYND